MGNDSIERRDLLGETDEGAVRRRTESVASSRRGFLAGVASLPVVGTALSGTAAAQSGRTELRSTRRGNYEGNEGVDLAVYRAQTDRDGPIDLFYEKAQYMFEQLRSEGIISGWRVTLYDTDRASTDRKTDDDNDDGDGSWGAYDVHDILTDEGWTDEDVAIWFTARAKIWDESEGQFEWQEVGGGSAGYRTPFDSGEIAQGWMSMKNDDDRVVAHGASMELMHTMVDGSLAPVQECSGADEHDDDSGHGHGGEHALGDAIYEYNEDYGESGYFGSPIAAGPSTWEQGACASGVDEKDGITFTLSECTKRATEYTKQDRVPGLTLDPDDPPCGGGGEFSGRLGGSRDRSATHTYTLESDVDSLEVSLSGPQGDDFDLYLTLDGRDPTRQDFDRSARTADAEETITIAQSLQAGHEIGVLVHAFSGAGRYNVSVEADPGVGPGPRAAFAADTPTEGAPGERLTFDGSVSFDRDGSIERYEWRFGDGTTATGSTVEHTYDDAGTYTVELTVTDDDDLTDTAQRRVRVGDANDPPVARIDGPDTVGVGEPVYIDAYGSDDPDGQIDQFRWAFGDGTVAYGSNPDHTYRSPGEYTVRLTVTDADGATASAEHTITVTGDNQAPDAALNAPDTLRPDETGTFRALAAEDPDGRIRQIKWEMGDGTVESGRFVFHSYDDPGVYSVQLTVTDEDGATDSTVHTVSVGNEEPVARIDAPDEVGIGESVTLDGSGSNDPDGGGLFSDGLEYAWSLGDRTTATGKRATHSYDDADTYTVELTVTDEEGATDTATHTLDVIDDNEEPVARIDAPDEVGIGESVTLDGSGSNDPDGGGFFTDGLEYDWDLGDWTDATGKRATHSYDGAGTYTVELTVTDEDGATDTAYHTLDVVDDNEEPVARIDAPDEVGVGESVTFDGSGSNDPDGGGFFTDGLEYEWDMGDWTDATGRRVTHDYHRTGRYEVDLTVTDEDGATDTTHHVISVVDDNEEPVARIDAPDTVEVGESVTFDGSDSYDPDGGGFWSDGLDYTWSFGDYNTGYGTRPSHSYDDAGTYTVSVTVTDEDGAVDTARHTITVEESGDDGGNGWWPFW